MRERGRCKFDLAISCYDFAGVESNQVFGPQGEQQEGDETEEATEDELWGSEEDGVEVLPFTPGPGAVVIDLTRDASPIFIDLTVSDEEE